MKKLLQGKRGWTLPEVATIVTLTVLIFLIALPVLSRAVDNIRNQSIMATLWALFDVQKSYRDAQTPTTYANNIETLISAGYIQENLNRYGYTFNVASITPDTFRIEALKDNGRGYSIDEDGTVQLINGGPDGGGASGPPPCQSCEFSLE